MRRKRCSIVLALWTAGFFLAGYGVWSFQGGELMLILYLAGGMIAYLVAAFGMRCPHCRMPVLLRPRTFLGIELFAWTVLPPKACRHCGEPLE